MSVELQPLLRWRMAEARDKAWRLIRLLAKRDPKYVDAVRAEVHTRGQLVARELETKRRPRAKQSTSWWGWDDRKRALAFRFWAGEITAIRSTTTFERVYAPLDRASPARVLAAPTPPRRGPPRLHDRSARSLGVRPRELAAIPDRVPLARRCFRAATPAARPVTVEAGASRRTPPDARRPCGDATPCCRRSTR
jgi:uncharacterized protein YcaQ